MKKATIINIVIISIFTLILFLNVVYHKEIVTWCVEQFINYSEEHNRIPDSGIYECRELEAKIVFLKNGSSHGILYTKEKKIVLFPGKGATFEGYEENGTGLPICDCHYHWERQENIIRLVFYTYPGDFEKEKEYIFSYIGNSNAE